MDSGGKTRGSGDRTGKPGAIGRAARGLVSAGAGAGRAGVRVVGGFWNGFTYPWKGARFVYLEHPGLVRYWIWPILITLACFAAVGLGVILWHDELLGLVWKEPEGHGFWIGLQRILRPVVQVILFVALAIAGIFAIYLLSSLFSAPFKDMLSEEVERVYKNRTPPPFSLARLARDLWLTIRLELGKSLAYVAVMLPGFILSLVVPVVGQVLYAAFGYVLTILFFAIDYTDWPLARRGRGVRERMRLLKNNFMPMFGLGAGVWLFLFIPFVGLLFMPAAVSGGTLLILDLEEDGALEWRAGRPGSMEDT